MAGSVAIKQLGLVMLFCMVVGAPVAQAALTCSQVASSVAPCINYLRNAGNGQPSPFCCNGIRALNSATAATADRQQACVCLKNIAASIPGINYGLANGLPGKCGVSIPYKISPSLDCKSVKY